MQALTHTCTHASTHIHILTRVHTHTNACTHVCTHTDMHTHTHTRRRIHTYTHACPHTTHLADDITTESSSEYRRVDISSDRDFPNSPTACKSCNSTSLSYCMSLLIAVSHTPKQSAAAPTCVDDVE